ncbi:MULTISPECIES: hypothetical protein [Chryseobacterium]|uniref:TonB C-terminal domain-containing protein n=1 Tax=Chryseobacterium taihuense TaxID=1141221 RepID=A0A4U8WDU6_9FLAO|nr:MULTISPECIES: hypothetical protein [Chryseobacterium]QQV02396.1 hypothetical protein I6I61_15210 [Chryseobacterium sp. FDAARGOS 1104]VFB04353.1 Uncharacterised protein [Chryseobacterium taihuense]
MKKFFQLLAMTFSVLYFAQTADSSKVSKTGMQKKQPTINLADIPDLEFVKTKLDLKGVVTKADELPEFPGGMKAFHKKYFENIQTLDLKHKEKIDTRLYFIVEKNGYVRNVTAAGTNKKHAKEAELGMRRIFERWKPAKLNGEPVRYLMYFPLTNKKY